MKTFLTLHINCTDTFEVKREGRVYRQILFDGFVTGDYFTGKILPGGVDTQKGNADGTGTLSARYILEGVDYKGNNCRIFVENSAESGSFITSPFVFTDSEELKFIEEKKIQGQMRFENKEFLIDILFEL